MTAMLAVQAKSREIFGYRSILGGREAVRKAMYMTALGAATRNNPILKTFYQKLLDAGKKKKVALVAVMRKLIVILIAIIKRNTTWMQQAA